MIFKLSQGFLKNLILFKIFFEVNPICFIKPINQMIYLVEKKKAFHDGINKIEYYYCKITKMCKISSNLYDKF